MRILFQSANQLKYREEMLWLGTTTTLATVIIWIIYAVYVAYNTPVVDEQVQNLLKALKSQFKRHHPQRSKLSATLPKNPIPLSFSQEIPQSAPSLLQDFNF
jgi:hypothetical protein